jgi:hypothetical protein
VEVFANALSARLEKSRVERRYERLHIIAPPTFLGSLRRKLSRETQNLIEKELPKDLSWLDRESDCKLSPSLINFFFPMKFLVETMHIPLGNEELEGLFEFPEDRKGVVVFAAAAGSVPAITMWQVFFVMPDRGRC